MISLNEVKVMRTISEYVVRLQEKNGAVNPEYYGVYERSVYKKEKYTVFMARMQDGSDRLCAFGKHLSMVLSGMVIRNVN
jgi:hypothetical protein